MTHALLATLGTEPAILTEAFWYHHVVRGITFSRVLVLTTTTGRDRANAVLFPEGTVDYSWRTMLASLSIDQASIQFEIIVLKNATGTELPDIREADENLGVQVMDAIKTLRGPQNQVETIRIHATFEGGRRDLAPLFTTAFQLATQPGDELFCVHLHQAIEDSALRPPGYLYPVEGVPKGNSLNVREQVHCPKVPVLYLGEAFPDLRKGTQSFTETIRRSQFIFEAMIDNLNLHLDWKKQEAWLVAASGEEEEREKLQIPFTPAGFYWYYIFARIRKGTLNSPDGDGLSLIGLADAVGELPVRFFTSQPPAERRDDWSGAIDPYKAVVLELDRRFSTKVTKEAEDVLKYLHTFLSLKQGDLKKVSQLTTASKCLTELRAAVRSTLSKATAARYSIELRYGRAQKGEEEETGPHWLALDAKKITFIP